MPKKLICIPENLFVPFMESMGQKEKHSNPKDSLIKLLNNKSIDPSAQNELYNQNLHSVLKHEKTLHEKPMRVQMAEDPEYVDNTNIYLRNAPGAVFSTRRDEDEVSLEDFEDAQEEFPEENDEIDEDEEEQDDLNFELNRSIQQVGAVDNPNRRHVPNAAQRIREQAQIIFRTLKKHPDIFRIAPDGRILTPSRRNVYSGSRPGDALKIIRRILGERDNFEIPTGYASFRKTLNENDASRRMIQTALGQVGGGWIFSNSPKKVIISKKKKVFQKKLVKKAPKKKLSKKKSSNFQVQRWVHAK